MRSLLTGLFAVLLAVSPGCSVSRRATDAGDVSGIDTRRCEAGGGQVKRVCLSGTLACVTPYPDAGRSCTDSSECEGMCLVTGEVPEVGSEVSGRCQEDDDPCGCFVEVRNGKSQQGLCAD